MYTKHTLDNGIRIVMEKIPYLRSVSIGIWIGAGSAYEDQNNNGISHFIEHMMFKGTKKRSAKQIAETMDAVGGQLNAFTAKECTCFYAKVIDEHVDLAIDLLADMILNSVFETTELEKEKRVILEEIFMYEDSPEDLVHDLLASSFFGNHPLGRPILGNHENLKKFDRDAVLAFIKQYYNPNNLIVSVAGNFCKDQILTLIEQYFSSWRQVHQPQKLPSVEYNGKGIFYRQKDIEQIHLCLGYQGVKLGQEETYPLMVFNNLFGGGMSSRLFQKVREEHGLAYSVASYPSNYTCGGLFTIYSSMKPTQVRDVLSIITDEIIDIKTKGVRKDEFVMAKEQLKGNYILGLEGSSSRMTAMGRAELLLGRVMTPSQILDKIDGVDIDQINGIAYYIFNSPNVTLALVGREDNRSSLEDILDF